MPAYASQIRDNYLRVCEQLAAATQEAGRTTESVTLIGISKYVDTEAAADLFAAGCQHLGESRPQELSAKATADCWPADTQPHWHMVGHLQRNKVDLTLPIAGLIHSVDSERLLKAINKEAAKQETVQPLLLQANCSGEESKYGLTAEATKQLAGQIADYSNVQLKGLMTMAARVGGPEVAAKNFASLRRLAEEIRPNLPDPAAFTELSMGMSGDFAAAIAEGATLVRVGSALWEGVPRKA